MKVVFDTKVVVSACFWRGAPFDSLVLWSRGAFSATVSPPFLAEYAETFQELQLDYPDRDCVDWVTALLDAAEMVFPVDRATGVTSDPFDEMVLECAIAAEADFIVTGDKKHLLPLGRFRDIPIVNPANFLRRIKP